MQMALQARHLPLARGGSMKKRKWPARLLAMGNALRNGRRIHYSLFLFFLLILSAVLFWQCAIAWRESNRCPFSGHFAWFMACWNFKSTRLFSRLLFTRWGCWCCRCRWPAKLLFFGHFWFAGLLAQCLIDWRWNFSQVRLCLCSSECVLPLESKLKQLFTLSIYCNPVIPSITVP